MSTDLLRYDLLVQEALKGVVRRILIDAAKDGLPGEHHFYISFRTEHAGVRLSNRLRERYPEDMTIVLQHQFENLTVTDQAFEVGLSFSGIPERLRVPFDSLSGFFDPSVQFGLKFETTVDTPAVGVADPDDAPAPGAPTQLKSRHGGVPSVPASLPKPSKVASGAQDTAPEPAEKKRGAKKKTDEEPAAATAEVVSLDAFRKKS